ncbi:MAG: Multidrug resistance protein MdtB [Paracidovorax wautersii]|uniref:Multidrug resistance protein MdtB n=1 Tax=Paracidovorax wautersii TaxID=1177982 RepID=A0A7V8JQL3_9BURK|nr:MAG: Multidrug resistance protein MdtB [Paracidovorax wautersii]
MNLSRLFILRPIATSLLMVAVLIAGALAYRLLPISALPEVDYPTIQVITLYPGASPDVMTGSVTAPLERQFGQMAGLEQMSSTSSDGASVITLRFALDVSLDVAGQEVQASINAAGSLLPSDLPMPPIYNKVNPADAPVLTLAVTSPSLPVTRVHDLVENRLAPKLSQVPGVGLVGIAGGARPAVRIQADPRALASAGLTLEDVRTAIAAANVRQSKGSFDGPARASNIDANDQLQSADGYRDLIIAYKNGSPIRLRDIAQAVDAAENARLAAWAGTPADGLHAGVVLNIQRQPGSNVIETVDRLKAVLPGLQASLPASVDVRILSDRTETIRASVRDVQFELALAVALVVMVIFLFLRSASATLIPALAVPLSLVGTFGVMYLCGFSVNNLTLMALTISTGFVVDDAIVMIENIARHAESGKSPMAAALDGSRQIGFTIVSLTVSLVAVLIPLLFMGDVVGRLFREFAVTLAVAILISAVVSLTLTPMLCARLLRRQDFQAAHHAGPRNGQSGPFARLHHATGAALERLTARYLRALDWVLVHRTITLAVFALTLALTALLYAVSPKGLFPQQDTGLLQATTEAEQSISFAAMADRQQALAERVLHDPAVASISSFIGVDGTNATPNTGRLLISLRPHGERDAIDTVMRRLAESTHDLPGIRLYLQPVQDLTIEDRVARTQYQLLLSSPDSAQMQSAATRLLARMRTLPELAKAASDLQDQGLQAWVEIDRTQASRLGVTVTNIDATLNDAFGQRLISTIYTQSNQYRVVLETPPRLREGPQALAALYVPSSNGVPVPLSAVAHVTERPTLLAINHVGQMPAATLSFDTAPGVALSDAVAAIARAHRAGPAGRGRPAVPGRGAGFPVVAVEHAAADPGRGGDHVHRAGRAL